MFVIPIHTINSCIPLITTPFSDIKGKSFILERRTLGNVDLPMTNQTVSTALVRHNSLIWFDHERIVVPTHFDFFIPLFTTCDIYPYCTSTQMIIVVLLNYSLILLIQPVYIINSYKTWKFIINAFLKVITVLIFLINISPNDKENILILQELLAFVTYTSRLSNQYRLYFTKGGNS